MAKAKVPFKYQSVVDAIAAKLKELPEGTETCTTGYGNALWKVAFYGAVAFSFEEYFEVDAQVRKQAKKAGILLDDTPWVGMELGLPYHFPFLVKHKNGLK